MVDLDRASLLPGGGDLDVLEVLAGQLGKERNALNRDVRLAAETLGLHLSGDPVLGIGGRSPVGDHQQNGQDYDHDGEDDGPAPPPAEGPGLGRLLDRQAGRGVVVAHRAAAVPGPGVTGATCLIVSWSIGAPRWWCR